MKIFAIAATALVAAVAYAAPAPIEDRQFQAQITFFAGPVQFTQSFPTDGSVVQINNPLNVNLIQSQGGATCTFFGSLGSVTTVVGAQTVPVSTPQQQVNGTCRAL